MALGLQQVGMIARVAERIERHDEVHHGRIDGAEAVGIAGAVEQPVLGLAQRRGAKIAGTTFVPEFDEPVQVVEQGGDTFGARQCEFLTGKVDLLEGHARGGRAVAARRLDNGKRNHDGARPRRHFVDHVAGQQHDLGRDGRHEFAREQAEQAQVDARITAASLHAAQAQNGLAGAGHLRAGRAVTGDAQRAVSLGGEIDVGARSGVKRKAAIRQLAFEDGAATSLYARAAGRIPTRAVGLMQPEIEQHGIGFERNIGGKIAAPVSIGALHAEQGLRGGIHGESNRRRLHALAQSRNRVPEPADLRRLRRFEWAHVSNRVIQMRGMQLPHLTGQGPGARGRVKACPFRSGMSSAITGLPGFLAAAEWAKSSACEASLRTATRP